MNTLGHLLQELQKVAEDQQPMSPDWWLDRAQRLAAMWMQVKEEKTKWEMAYKKEIVALLEAGDSVSKAQMKVEATSENYKCYRYCIAKDEQIENIIQIAKKRVSIEMK